MESVDMKHVYSILTLTRQRRIISSQTRIKLICIFFQNFLTLFSFICVITRPCLNFTVGISHALFTICDEIENIVLHPHTYDFMEFVKSGIAPVFFSLLVVVDDL